MDELSKGLKISVAGKLREEALEKFKERIKKWDIALPDMIVKVLR